jgi:DNA-binding GntR family transcriptional regulator
MLIQSAVVRAACEQRTELDLVALRESVERAVSVPASDGWERRAAAHAEFHNLLADVTGNPVLAILVRSMTDTLREVVVAVGPSADDLIVSSRRRLLGHLRAGDAERAAEEMEDHLACLDDMLLKTQDSAGVRGAPEAVGPAGRRGTRPGRRRPARRRMDSVILSRQLSDPPRVFSPDHPYPHRVG